MRYVVETLNPACYRKKYLYCFSLSHKWEKSSHDQRQRNSYLHLGIFLQILLLVSFIFLLKHHLFPQLSSLNLMANVPFQSVYRQPTIYLQLHKVYVLFNFMGIFKEILQKISLSHITMFFSSHYVTSAFFNIDFFHFCSPNNPLLNKMRSIPLLYYLPNTISKFLLIPLNIYLDDVRSFI